MPEDKLKSAFDLAMERADAEGGASRTLSLKDKESLAEIRRDYAAKVAELEIKRDAEIAASISLGNFAQVETIRANHAEKIRKLSEEEKKKTSRLRKKA